jgi:hypothetical protein
MALPPDFPDSKKSTGQGCESLLRCFFRLLLAEEFHHALVNTGSKLFMKCG